MNLIRCYIVILFFLSACNDRGTVDNISLPNKIITLDSVKLIDVNNSPVNLKQFEGKALFINFWATWCKPCLEEMPSIQKAMGVLKNEKIEFLFASDETAEQIENFKKQHVYDFNFVRAENLAELNIMALPTTFIFTPGGRLVFNEMGYRQWDVKSNIDLIINISKEK